MPGHRQPLASPDGEVFSPRCRKDVLCSWHTVLYARPLFRKKRREYIYIYIIIQIFLSFFRKTVSKRRTLSELNWSLMCPKRPQRHFVNCFVRANQPLAVREDVPVTNLDAKSPETRHKVNYLRRIMIWTKKRHPERIRSVNISRSMRERD